jgi:hypothetical protein
MLPQIPSKIRYGAITAASLIVIWLLAVVLVPLFIDHEALRKQAETQLSEAFGYSASIRSSRISFVFAPKITFEGIVVRNDPTATSDKTLAANQVELNFSLLSLMQGKLEAINMHIDGVFVEIEELKKGVYNVPFPKKMSAIFSPYFPVQNMHITDGRVHISPFQSSAGGYSLKSLEGDFQLTPQGDFQTNTSFFLDKDRFGIALSGNVMASDADDRLYTVSASVTKGDESIAYTGELGEVSKKLYAKGKILFNVEDVKAWLDSYDIEGKQANLYSILKQRSLKGDMTIQRTGDNVSFATETVKLDDQPINIKSDFLFGDITKMQVSSVIQKIAFTSQKDFM